MGRISTFIGDMDRKKEKDTRNMYDGEEDWSDKESVDSRIAREIAPQVWKDYDDEPTLWTKYKVGKRVLEVCNKGYVRISGQPFWCVNKGIPLTGTPYSYLRIENEDDSIQTVLMHQLIWKAFNGDIPTGWEVRHKPCVPIVYTREYPNDLSLLDIYPILA